MELFRDFAPDRYETALEEAPIEGVIQAADLVRRLAESKLYLLLRSLFILFTDSVSTCSLKRFLILFP
jgi:hypothetical protein